MALLGERHESTVGIEAGGGRRWPAWDDGDANGVWGDGRDAQLDGLAGDDQIFALRAGVDPQEDRGAERAKALQGVTSTWH
jgi:hypothetical protein